MRCVAAVRTRHDVAAEASRSARAAVASGATVGETRADGEIDVDVAEPVAGHRALPLEVRELALKQLPPTANGAKRILGDHPLRSIRIGARASIADLAWVGSARQWPGNPLVRGVRRFVLVDQLPDDSRRGRQHQHGRADEDGLHRTPLSTGYPRVTHLLETCHRHVSSLFVTLPCDGVRTGARRQFVGCAEAPER